MKQLAVEGKRVGKVGRKHDRGELDCLVMVSLFTFGFAHQVLDNAIETEKMINKYETLASDLLIWIEQTIVVLNNRKLANSLTGVQQQLQAFNTYRTVEKPPK